jgi:VanZ family protein
LTLFTPALAGWFRLLLAVTVVLLTWQMLTPDPTALPIHHGDKLAHAGAFLLLAFLCDAAWPLRRIGWRALTLLAVYGAIIELLQGLIAGRQSSAADLAANIAGLALYSALIGPWLRQRFHRD